jgi:hypothetical protein
LFFIFIMFKVLMFYLFCEKMGREAQLLLLFSAAPPIASVS